MGSELLPDIEQPNLPDDRPFAYFQWNSGWGVWEQVVDEAKEEPRVVAAWNSRSRTITKEQVEEVEEIIFQVGSGEYAGTLNDAALAAARAYRLTVEG